MGQIPLAISNENVDYVDDPDVSGSAQVVSADSAAFENIFNSEYRRLVRIAKAITQDAGSAEEVVQDAFVAALTQWRHIDAPAGYLTTCVARGAARKTKGARHARDLRENASSYAVVDIADGIADSQDLSQSLSQLTSRQRAALVLRYYAELPDKEIASILRCRPGTVASLIHRALNTLRSNYGKTLE